MSRRDPASSRHSGDAAAFTLEPVERLLVGEVIAVVMRHRNTDRLALVIAAREQRLAVLDFQCNGAADEILAGIAHQAPGGSPASVSTGNRCTPSTGFRVPTALDRRASPGCSPPSPGPQVIAIGETAGQGDEIEPLGQFGIGMPDLGGALPRPFDRHRHVAIAVRPGKVMTAARKAIRRPSRYGNSRSPCWRAASRTCRSARHRWYRRPRRGRSAVRPGHRRLRAKPSPSSAWWTARPCGSSTPGLSETWTRIFIEARRFRRIRPAPVAQAGARIQASSALAGPRSCE